MKKVLLDLGLFSVFTHHLTDYMWRWVLKTPWGSVRLHRILRADADPDMHDHPWNFWSLIVWGGYTERVPNETAPGTKRQIFHTFMLNRKKAQEPHLISSVLPNTWTLVVTGRKVRHWGFWTPNAWIPWRTYVKNTK